MGARLNVLSRPTSLEPIEAVSVDELGALQLSRPKLSVVHAQANMASYRAKSINRPGSS